MNTFSYHGNYILDESYFGENNDTCYAAFIDDAKKNLSKDWPIAKEINFRVSQILHHDKYNFQIIDGYFPKEKLQLFEEYMKKLDEALTLLYGQEYEESKTYALVCHKVQCLEEDDKGGVLNDNRASS